jgi:magnesium chelatase subunit I
VREGLREVFAKGFGGTNLRGLIDFFEQGGEVGVASDKSASDLLAALSRVPGLLAHAGRLIPERTDAPTRAAAAEFILEGLFALKKIGRSDEGAYIAVERKAEEGPDIERMERLARMKRQVN